MKIGTLALGALSAAVLALSAPASAAVTELKFTAPGPAAQVYIVGLNPDNHSLLYDGLGAELDLTLTSIDNSGYRFNFAYALKNVSTVASRVGTIGWNIGPQPFTVSGVGGSYGNSASGNMSFHGVVDFCLKNSNGASCGGGGGGGPSMGQSAAGTFSLNYKSTVTTMVSSQVPVYGKGKNKNVIVGYTTVQTPVVTPVLAPKELVFNNFGTHWQSLPGGRSTVGVPGERPLVVTAVPEPATWAMMIVGFGAVGAVIRQRRRVALA